MVVICLVMCHCCCFCFQILRWYLDIVDGREWLGNLTKFFVVCFCSLFGLDQAQNTIVVYSVLRN